MSDQTTCVECGQPLTSGATLLACDLCVAKAEAAERMTTSEQKRCPHGSPFCDVVNDVCEWCDLTAERDALAAENAALRESNARLRAIAVAQQELDVTGGGGHDYRHAINKLRKAMYYAEHHGDLAADPAGAREGAE